MRCVEITLADRIPGLPVIRDPFPKVILGAGNMRPKWIGVGIKDVDAICANGRILRADVLALRAGTGLSGHYMLVRERVGKPGAVVLWRLPALRERVVPQAGPGALIYSWCKGKHTVDILAALRPGQGIACGQYRLAMDAKEKLIEEEGL